MLHEQVTAELPAHVPAALAIDFDVYDPPNVADDLQLAWKALQEPGIPDMVWSIRNGGHWLPTRGRLVATMFADHENFSNRYAFLPKEAAEHHHGIPGTLDPPQHQVFRSLLNPMLGPKPVKGLETEIRALAGSMIESICSAGRCEFTSDYASVLPVSVFFRLVDLPIQDRVKLQTIQDCIIRPTNASMSVEEATMQLLDYLRAPINERLGGDGKDMLSQVINGQVFGRSLTSDEALNLALLVLQGGLDTVANLMNFAIHFLATHPTHRRELVEHPELIPAAVEELIRRFPVVVNARTVKRDMTYAGVEMKQGDAVVLSTLLHGLDERANERSLQCDFHRSAREYSTFGQGVHKCVGSHLARLQVRITLEEWLARIPEFEFAAPGIRCRGGLVGGMLELPLRWDVASTHSKVCAG